MIRREIDALTVVVGMAIYHIMWAPHDVYCNRKVKKKAQRNQQIYKEMYRGKYGY